jgi:hypothetical protein
MILFSVLGVVLRFNFCLEIKDINISTYSSRKVFFQNIREMYDRGYIVKSCRNSGCILPEYRLDYRDSIPEKGKVYFL